MMTKEQALKLLEQIQSLCRQHGLWVTVEHENKPDLRMIRIKEISIKVKSE
ncbi:MAG: hypothetical protein JSV01_04880 [Desulfobacterales bacterium]|nr:MAG: hypothetical protein JSV01_04880 [Desulfobacterales bacterium]